MIPHAGHLVFCPLHFIESLELDGHQSKHWSPRCSRPVHIPHMSYNWDWLSSPWSGQRLVELYNWTSWLQQPANTLHTASDLVGIYSSYGLPAPQVDTTPIPSLCGNSRLDSHVCKSGSVSHYPHPDHLKFTAEVISLFMGSESREDIGDKGDQKKRLPIVTSQSIS